MTANKMHFSTVAFILLGAVKNTEQTLAESSINNLEKSLKFFDEKYYQFNFDGVFGMTLAQAQLIKIFYSKSGEDHTRDIGRLIEKCQVIHDKIVPLLPDYPYYMKTFREKLLSARNWSNILPSRFKSCEISSLEYYSNWTTDTLLKHKEAVYKGVRSDVCLREILEKSVRDEPCYVSHICNDMMLNKYRIDHGYLLTHKVLYIQIARLQGCFLPNIWSLDDYLKQICSYVYKEAKTNEHLGFPYRDIFMEQVLLCGAEGFEEFLAENWHLKVLNWQSSQGCYRSLANQKIKRTSNIIAFGCSDHSTGLGLATTALYLRYLLSRTHKWNK